MKDDALSGILSTAAMIGVGLTGYFSYKAGKDTANNKPGLTKYIAPIVSGAATVACLWAAHKLSVQQLAMLGATAGYLAKERDKLWSKVPTEEVTGTVEEQYADLQLPKAAEDTGRGSDLVFEAYSGRWYYSSEEAVKAGIEAFNEFYGTAGAACYNDFYREQGLMETHFGYQMGYVSVEGYSSEKIEFNVSWIGLKGTRLLVVEPLEYPFEGWEEI